MSPSSSGSWTGSRGADIIDLDRYMRGAVRPSRGITSASYNNELVVDAGGVTKVARADRYKHYSHDSGVSDSSYSRQRRLHKHLLRRQSTLEGTQRRPRPRAPSARAADSTNSLRTFRAVCEQALLDQQRQIAHVAQLCEQLTLKAAKSERKTNHESRRETSVERRASRERVKERRSETRVPSTSDISSTSRSTRVQDPRRKDRHRTDECKTYKIIMSKLDELNRLFSTKPARCPPPRPPHTPSSTSVSVCDKLIATDPERVIEKVIKPSVKTLYGAASRGRSARRGAFAGRVTHAFAVDIAPAAPAPAPNVVTECVVKCETSGASGVDAGDPCCGFDLDDPVHLYSQAKRLQTLHATTGKRTRSLESGRASSRKEFTQTPGEGDPAGCPGGAGVRARAPSLCAVCRGYWRALTHCIVGLVAPRHSCPC